MHLISFLKHLTEYWPETSLSLIVRENGDFEFSATARPFDIKNSHVLRLTGFADDINKITVIHTHRLMDVSQDVLSENECISTVWNFLQEHKIHSIKKECGNVYCDTVDISKAAETIARYGWTSKSPCDHGITLENKAGDVYLGDRLRLTFKWGEYKMVELSFFTNDFNTENEFIRLDGMNLTQRKLSNLIDLAHHLRQKV